MSSLPLLSKELLALSGRLRTYVVRVIYAASLMLIGMFTWSLTLNTGSVSAWNILGSGETLLLYLCYAQHVGLQVVLPPITCGVFTVEKERNTLGLLFLTRLGPWTILLEKFLSRLLLAWSFLLVSVPILAFCYALGGITVEILAAQVLRLMLAALVIVACSILCSTYFRTTTAALLGSYALIYGSRLILQGGVLSPWFNNATFGPSELIKSLFLEGGISLEGLPYRPFNSSRIISLGSVVQISIHWCLFALLCVLMSRRYLVSHAFLPPRSRQRGFLYWLDRKLHLTRAIRWLCFSSREPATKPVAWRETAIHPLPQIRAGLVGGLILLEVVTLVIAIRAIYHSESYRFREILPTIQAVEWIGMLLLTCVVSAGLITDERARQTLDILLTTPLKAREIVQQKLAGVRQLICLCELPLWTCVLFRYWIERDSFHLIGHGSMLLIYPWLVGWIGMTNGLSARTSLGAVVKTLVEVLFRCLAPPVLLSLVGSIFAARHAHELLAILTLISPGSLYYYVESSNPYSRMYLPGELLLIGVNTLFHGLILANARYRCLSQAETLLRNNQPVLTLTRISGHYRI